jgi:hypothetical protein
VLTASSAPLPGLERDDIGTWLQVIDPFGNTLRFLE